MGGEPLSAMATLLDAFPGVQVSEGATLATSALEYAASGWEVFPLRGKAPLISKENGGNGVLDATADLATVESWWSHWPNANVGGRVPEGVVVVDVDPRHDGDDSLARLEKQHGALPKTLTSLSGRDDGGRHRYFRHPGGEIKTERLRREGFTGIDVKTRSGYVVLPPSVHPATKSSYRWVDRSVSVATMPAWLVDLLRPVERPPAPSPPLRPYDGDSIADWFSANHTWADVLCPFGWVEVRDGWRHPAATSPVSATVRHDCLFVYSTNTPFEPTEPGGPHGYTKFGAWTILAHGGDGSAAARAARELKGDPIAPKSDLPRIEQRRHRPVHDSGQPPTCDSPIGDMSEAEARDTQDPRPDEGPNLFRRWTMGELLAADRTFRWQINGHSTVPTYGMTAGEMKTLKTHVDMFTNVAVAAGVPLFDHFVVGEPSPVVVYVGEGGRVPYTRRLERIANAMNVNLADIPLHVSFDTAPVLSPVFQASLARDLEEIRPGRVSLDPLYAFHGAGSDARNLHEEGGLLNALSRPCVEAGAVLNLVNHYNQTGTSGDLKRITMAGGGEWVDSWWLLSHREPPNVDEGRFKLLFQIGSRQWGGTTWDLDLSVGEFNVETGEFDGEITWDLRRHAAVGPVDRTDEALIGVLRDLPLTLTKTEVLEKVGGNRKTARRAFETLERDGSIVSRFIKRSEGAREVTREVWCLPDEPGPNPDPAGTGWEDF